jgi:hypothetical protein
MVCTAGEFDALLKNERDAEVAPLNFGVKVTVKGTDWPAAIVAPENPETNSALLRLSDVTATGAPLAVRVPLSEELEPTTTLPKLKLDGETANVPAAVPLPDNAIAVVEFDAFDVTDKFPLAVPPTVGVNVTVNVTL